METRPVFRSLNKQLTLLGVNRTGFFVLLIASLLTFHLSERLVPAVVLFGVLWIPARAMTHADPQFLRIFLKSSRFASRYDPARRGEGRNGNG